jgi:dTDP-glucose pyrophosphorylase
MSNELALIVPAAGRGSRFSKLGLALPKPLIELEGRPFVWWAVESVLRQVKLRQLVFVVLDEHIANYAIDQRIRSYWPDATVVALAEVTSGAAETAAVGLDALTSPGPVAINDCDHAFVCGSLPYAVRSLQSGSLEAMLMCFRSANPAYSYARLGASGEVTGTAEKRVISPFAIAGCYLFRSAERFQALYQSYRESCPYDELFISGLFNLLLEKGGAAGMMEADAHCSFGTPEELEAVTAEVFAPFKAWK